MLFHTWVFAAFFVVALGGHLALRRTAAGNAWLLVASYVFYGWWQPWFVLLMMASTAVDYLCGRAMATAHASRRRRVAATKRQ